MPSLPSLHFHRWKYLDSEDRICSTCGECQCLYLPPSGWFKHADSDQPEYIPNPDPYWKTCLADELEKHVADTKEKLEKQALREEASRRRAFELVGVYEPAQALEVCRKCGARTSAEANFCTVCGSPVNKF